MTGPPLVRDAAEDIATVRSWRGLPPGPAGVVSIEPADGLLLVFDAADLHRVVSLQVDTAAAPAQALSAVAGGGWDPDAEQWAPPAPAAPAVLDTLARRALLDALPSEHPLRPLDIALLGLRLPATLQPADLPAALSLAGTLLLGLPPDIWRPVIPDVLEEVARAAQQLADVLWTTQDPLAAGLDGYAMRLFEESERRQRPRPLRPEDREPTQQVAAEAAVPMAAAAARAPAPAAAARSRADAEDAAEVRVLLDARVAEAAGIDPSSVTAARQHASEPLVVRARVDGVLGEVWARVWQRRGDVLVASGRLTGGPMATVQLPLPAGVGVSAIELDVVDDPRAPRVRADAVRLAEAWRAGWRALAEERMRRGVGGWETAARTWIAVGDADRAALAQRYSGGLIDPSVERGVTWSLPLLGEQRQAASAFLHERVAWRDTPPPPRRGRGRGGRSGGGWNEPPDPSQWDPRDFL